MLPHSVVLNMLYQSNNGPETQCSEVWSVQRVVPQCSDVGSV